MSRSELRVERLSKSGEGVAHLDGRAVFISGALPGETVVAEVVEAGKVLRGELLELITPSAERRVPMCPLATTCGGCPWMHLVEPGQLAAKEEIVRSTLEHVGGIDLTALQVLPTFASPLAVGYRRRATLHPVQGRLGFFGRRTHDRVIVDLCPALTEPLQHLPSLLSDSLGAALKDVEEVRVLECESRIAISVHLKGALRPKVTEAIEPLIREGFIAGALLVPGEGKGGVTTRGAPVLEEEGLFYRPDGFAQANARVNAALVARSIEWLEPQAASVLELYSGNGNFTLPLAVQATHVTAIESSAISIQLAVQAARARTNIRFVQSDAEKSADGLVREGARFDRLLLDPPRTGAPKVGTWASRLLVSHVVYVACDPVSLARDAASLITNGFRPTALQLFDLFPQTHHIEAVMAFRR